MVLLTGVLAVLSSLFLSIDAGAVPREASASAAGQVVVAETRQEGKMPWWMEWGAYAGWEMNAMRDFEERVGKKARLEMRFVHWGSDPLFPSEYAALVREEEKTLVLFWEALDYERDYFAQPEFSFDAVLSGALDDYFKNFALDAKAYGAPVILIPYSEFNGNWFPWSGTVGNNTPEKYIAAYRYVRKFFYDVPNVRFGWVPNNRTDPDIPSNAIERYYPGGDVVDVVGVDGFNFGGNEAQTFDALFADTLGRLREYDKPIYIFSMGTASSPGKPAWITEALSRELYKYPDVKGWLWFNAKKERDWRVTENPESLEAFRNVLP